MLKKRMPAGESQREIRRQRVRLRPWLLLQAAAAGRTGRIPGLSPDAKAG